MNNEGQKVKEYSDLAANDELDITELPSGLYILTITTERGDLISKKIVRQ